MLARAGPRDIWSTFLQDTIQKYNSTKHSVTKFPPAVLLYSHFCSEFNEVPISYRDVVGKELTKYDTWSSMRLVVQATAKVRFNTYFYLPFLLVYWTKENMKKAAQKSIEDSIRRSLPTDITVGSKCRLLSPGD